MSNKKIDTYGIALLIGIFLCGTENNAMSVRKGSTFVFVAATNDIICALYNERVIPIKKRVQKDLETELDITNKALELTNERLISIKQLKKEIPYGEKLGRIINTKELLNCDKQRLENHVEIIHKKLNNPDGYIKWLNWTVFRGDAPAYAMANEMAQRYYSGIIEYKRHIETLSQNKNSEDSVYDSRIAVFLHDDQAFDGLVMRKLDKVKKKLINEGLYNIFDIAKSLELNYSVTDTAPPY